MKDTMKDQRIGYEKQLGGSQLVKIRAATCSPVIHDRVAFVRCKILSLERKCSSGVGRLKTTIEGHLQNGIPSPDIWEKTLSFLSVKKAPLFHNGYSRCSREALRLFPEPADDVAPLCCRQ
ncbi:hypothetical protein Z043_122347 [Scleropages formosus]|uniref:Uncharacterized protein n=1 Tax=Scleropages formosus TaxID=113540 RepID=A0A0P7UFA9_SCLFO|nr:hypothetical protein Z043_122347 [Scleropages formosus]